MIINPATKQTEFEEQDSPSFFHVIDVTDDMDTQFVEDVQISFDKLIVTSVSEQHVDAADVVDVLADTYIAYSMGANPVRVHIGCVVKHTKENDHYLDFLKYYHERVRGTMLSKDRLIIYFIYIDQYMCLRINNIAVRKDSNLDDMVNINIQGIGFNFGNFKGIVSTQEEVTTATIDPDPELITRRYDDDIELVEKYA